MEEDSPLPSDEEKPSDEGTLPATPSSSSSHPPSYVREAFVPALVPAAADGANSAGDSVAGTGQFDSSSSPVFHVAKGFSLNGDPDDDDEPNAITEGGNGRAAADADAASLNGAPAPPRGRRASIMAKLAAKTSRRGSVAEDRAHRSRSHSGDDDADAEVSAAIDALRPGTAPEQPHQHQQQPRTRRMSALSFLGLGPSKGTSKRASMLEGSAPAPSAPRMRIESVDEGDGGGPSSAAGSSAAGSLRERRIRRDSVSIASKRTALTQQEAERAAVESDAAKERAVAATYRAHLATVDAGRADWEARTMAFLAAGNARHPNGTFIATFLRVQDELAEAETNGVPLSETARTAIVKMGLAEKAIRAASTAAKLAADRAAAEYAASGKGARRRAFEERVPTAAEKAHDLSAEATRLQEEATLKEGIRREAQTQMEEAQREEMRQMTLLREHQAPVARWRTLSGAAGSLLSCCCVPPRIRGGATGGERVLPSERNVPPPLMLSATPGSPGGIQRIASPANSEHSAPAAAFGRNSSPAMSGRNSSPAFPRSSSPAVAAASHMQKRSDSPVPMSPLAGSSFKNAFDRSAARGERCRRPSEELQQKTLAAMQPAVRRFSMDEEG